MTTIYLVSQGRYSEYHICGVFSTEALAQEAAHVWGDDCDIEEYELDAMPDHPPGLVAWGVQMDREGAYCFNGQRRAPRTWRSSPPDYVGSFYTHHDSQETMLTLYLWARDAEHAIKIANEKRIQLLAANAWPDDPKNVSDTARAILGAKE